MKEKLLLEPQKITAGLINETKNSDSPKELIFVTPAENVGAALKIMNENGITQIPVLDNQVSVGSLRESRILTKLIENRELLDASVGEVMEKSFPIVDVDASSNTIKVALRKSPAVLIEDFKRITGIITRSDVLDLPK
jgi:cystathionine beta-synthase